VWHLFYSATADVPNLNLGMNVMNPLLYCKDAFLNPPAAIVEVLQKLPD
jgi:hypothetical protein